MAGVKRRTSYRKTVTDDVLYGVPELPEGHRVAVLLRSHGGNLLEVRTDAGDEGIALLPTKYRKLIWIKRGDHLVVSEATGSIHTAGGGQGTVRFLIEAVLYPDAIKALQRLGKWPAAFAAAAVAGGGGGGGGGVARVRWLLLHGTRAAYGLAVALQPLQPRARRRHDLHGRRLWGGCGGDAPAGRPHQPAGAGRGRARAAHHAQRRRAGEPRRRRHRRRRRLPIVALVVVLLRTQTAVGRWVRLWVRARRRLARGQRRRRPPPELKPVAVHARLGAGAAAACSVGGRRRRHQAHRHGGRVRPLAGALRGSLHGRQRLRAAAPQPVARARSRVHKVRGAAVLVAVVVFGAVVVRARGGSRRSAAHASRQALAARGGGAAAAKVAAPTPAAPPVMQLAGLLPHLVAGWRWLRRRRDARGRRCGRRARRGPLLGALARASPRRALLLLLGALGGLPHALHQLVQALLLVVCIGRGSHSAGGGRRRQGWCRRRVRLGPWSGWRCVLLCVAAVGGARPPPRAQRARDDRARRASQADASVAGATQRPRAQTATHRS